MAKMILAIIFTISFFTNVNVAKLYHSDFLKISALRKLSLVDFLKSCR